ncbi:hypothetical protein ACH5RR_026337 [Cinchona calisaya]|uniref:Uncharacterized protein n=1 Tax=Cinchona calisaya TaxID=153742 RepID=A0ABD2Z2A2_9GENT
MGDVDINLTFDDVRVVHDSSEVEEFHDSDYAFDDDDDDSLIYETYAYVEVNDDSKLVYNSVSHRGQQRNSPASAVQNKESRCVDTNLGADDDTNLHIYDGHDIEAAEDPESMESEELHSL